ncbi:MAG: aldo/keto reductase [Roseibacillus sp.]
MPPDRRSFLKTLAASAVALPHLNAEETSDKLGKILPTRPLGRTGESISAFSLGGAHVVRAENEATSEQIIETAIECGVRSFDQAQKYGNGESEVLYGKYLTPKYRDHVYLTTKTHAKTSATARKELETSLRSMKTDHLDLWQIHSITSAADVDRRWEGGVIDEFLKAREEGLVRHIGFTGHRSPSAHLHLIKRLREANLLFDTCLMPMNLVDPHWDSFIVQVLPELLKDNYGIFAMKTLAHGNMLGAEPNNKKTPDIEGVGTIVDSGLTVKDMHHYIYSLPITSLISGCLKPHEVKENTTTLRNYRKLDIEERDKLLARAKPFAGNQMEYYKGKPI